MRTSFLLPALNLVLTLILFSAGAALGAPPVAPSPSPSAAPPSLSIALVDDPTGGAAKCALDPTTASQLVPLLELAGTRTLSVSYWLIQEAVSEPVTLAIHPCKAEVPEMPSKALPAPAYQKAAKLWLSQIQTVKAERAEWEKTSLTEFEGFLVRSTDARLALEARWLAAMKARQRDFRRSAVASTIIAAAQRPAPVDFLVISSDGIDEPGGAPAGRKAPLTAAEVPESTEVIFISPDGKPPGASLFAQLAARGQTHLARDLAETARLIVAHEQPLRGAKITKLAR